MENSNQLVKCNKLKTSTAMFQDYKLKIEFENCSYDYPYLVEGCANSCIKLNDYPHVVRLYVLDLKSVL
jgi:hypothetical protein